MFRKTLLRQSGWFFGRPSRFVQRNNPRFEKLGHQFQRIEALMKHDPKVGTTDQKPKWEGPPENRPHGYEPAVDNPAKKRDAAGHRLSDPDRKNLSDAQSEPQHAERKGDDG
ncbi:hypothetical protein [Brucella rhizosphaerae]